MKIGMIGMGFVGGTTAKVMEEKHEILPYDRYKEPYNDEKHLVNLVKNADVAFLCVPTPMELSGEINLEPMHYSLQKLEETSNTLGRDPNDLLITVRSTAVSGTTDSFAEKYPFPFAFNPEFLREKHAFEDMKNTSYIVLGVEDKLSERKLIDVYKPLFPNAEIIVTNRRTAEMAKYANNARLASMVMVDNDIYGVCDVLGVDYKVIQGILSKDSRNGRVMDVPGPDGDRGFGGKCFPKDLNALIYLARENGYRANLLSEVMRSNLDVRQNRDWEDIPGATSANQDFEKK